MQDATSTLDALICAQLRGERPPWPWGEDSAAASAFLARTRLHGVQALLHAGTLGPQWPTDVRDALRDQAIAQAIWELRHQQVLVATLAALASNGVRPVLLKGTAMAYSLYPDPSLRTRADTDLLIAPHQKAAAFAALEALGFERDFGVTGEFISYQSNFSTHTQDGANHTLDVHWKINNSQVLSRLLRYDEALAAGTALPLLSADAVGVSRVHGLLVTAFHRATHIQNPYYIDGVAHYGGDRLIWLHDIHLLASSLSSAEWQSFCAIATRKGLAPVCGQALRDASHRLGTRVPGDVHLQLASTDQATPPARYLAAGRMRQQWMDFLALEGSRLKSQYLAELLFPAASYMRGKYGTPGSAWLPWLYARRAVIGACKTIGLGR